MLDCYGLVKQQSYIFNTLPTTHSSQRDCEHPCNLSCTNSGFYRIDHGPHAPLLKDYPKAQGRNWKGRIACLNNLVWVATNQRRPCRKLGDCTQSDQCLYARRGMSIWTIWTGLNFQRNVAPNQESLACMRQEGFEIRGCRISAGCSKNINTTPFRRIEMRVNGIRTDIEVI